MGGCVRNGVGDQVAGSEAHLYIHESRPQIYRTRSPRGLKDQFMLLSIALYDGEKPTGRAMKRHDDSTDLSRSDVMLAEDIGSTGGAKKHKP